MTVQFLFCKVLKRRIIDIIEKLIHLLSLSDIEKAEEFQKEFLFYWNQAAEDTGICKLYIGKEREFQKLNAYKSNDGAVRFCCKWNMFK